MSLRMTRAERERKRIEEAEVSRRILVGEAFDVPPNPRDVVAQAALAEFRRAERELNAGLHPAPEPTPCELHPEWRPASWTAGQPRPPASLCPRCSERQPKPVAQEVYLDGSGPQRSVAPAVQRAWERYLEARRAAGQVLSGSPEEDAALRRMDELREDEARSSGKGRTPAWARYDRDTDSWVVGYHRPWRRKRRSATVYARDGSFIVGA
jgi:hypothetical protein